MTAAFAISAIDARRGGVSRTGTAAANATALQAMIDGMDETGGAIAVREPYPCNPITLRKNVSLFGCDGPRFQGPYPYGGGAAASDSKPAGGGFVITSTSAPFILLEGMNTVKDLTFFYPSQNYAATTVAGTTSYPATIANGQAVTWNVSIAGCLFVGATTCMDFNHVTMTEGANFNIDECYGYTLGGYFLRLATVLDIPRVTRCHVNPGAGSRFMVCPNTNVPFPYALIDDVITNGQPMFHLTACDEFMASQCFVFGGKTGFYATTSYGCFTNCQADMVTTGIDVSPGAAHKAILVNGFTAIPSAGPTTSARDAVKFSGAGGILKIVNLHAFIGTNAAVGSSSSPGASANSLVKVHGSGAQRLDLFSGTKVANSGTWTAHVDQVNGSATVNQTASP